MKFIIELAKKRICIQSIYEDVARLCKEYCIDSASYDFEVISTMEKIEKEQSDGSFSAGYLETLSIYREIVTKMLEYNTFLMHGSIIATDSNRAYMFTAPSGTGKTTHTRLWLENCPSSFVVNGDKPLLIVEENQVVACGTPWSGKEGMNTNCRVPLKGIVILERGEENEIEESSLSKAFTTLFQQTYRPKKAEDLKKTLDLFQQLSKFVKIYKMKVNNFKEDAFSVSYQAIVKK